MKLPIESCRIIFDDFSHTLFVLHEMFRTCKYLHTQNRRTNGSLYTYSRTFLYTSSNAARYMRCSHVQCVSANSHTGSQGWFNGLQWEVSCNGKHPAMGSILQWEASCNATIYARTMVNPHSLVHTAITLNAEHGRYFPDRV